MGFPEKMKMLYLFKVIKDTRLFRKGQKVWSFGITGAMAAFAIGRYKDKGRWINAWVRWDDTGGRGRPNVRCLGEIEVTDKFYERMHKIAYYN
jgi:hypothetical protein